ncbi:MAG: ATP-grasp domain-containing protein [Candidatus Saccharibacteria bacterium]
MQHISKTQKSADSHAPKQIVVVGRHDDRASYDTPQSMARELNKRSSRTIYSQAILEQLLFVYDGSKLRVLDDENQDLSRHDGIFLIGWFKEKMLEDEALAVTMYAQAHGMSFLNSEAGRTRSNSKLSQCVAAVLHDVQTTPFVFAQDGVRLLQGVDQSNLTYPLIAKSVRASRGNDNYLVGSRTELQKIITENPDVPFIVQAFVPNDGDYRVIVMGDTVKFVMHRKSQTDSHLNNTSQGGEAHEIAIDSLPAAMLDQSVAIAKVLHREITGVDMIVDKTTGKHYFLEANNMPQLSTGSLVEAKTAALNTFLTTWIEATP